MNIILKDRALLFHHIEWVLLHPRFGFLMIGLILLSFTHDPAIALFLFTIFMVEVTVRGVILFRKARVNPYRASIHRRIDAFLLCIDLVGIFSLLITVLDIQVGAENIALVRLVRASYLLRTLRIFRYIDLHAVMFSPAYGMFISLVIISSFFAVETLLWLIIIFFFVELSLRLIILRHMHFESERERKLEWMYWWLDLVATICMLPVIVIIPYSGALRMLRLIRLFRPWKVILSNLQVVLREGQFMQEITLIILILAILSLGGGGIVFLFFDVNDYIPEQIHSAFSDQPILAAIWFAFRLLTDPGNSVEHPEAYIIAFFSIASVILGVFIFAFFIGIGANIVSGLMKRLKNEKLVINNHLVIFGWTAITPFIVTQLSLIAERNFSKLKVILLHHTENPPHELLEDKWVTYRYGALENPEDLKRVHIAAAKQALVNLPADQTDALSVANAFHNVMTIRKQNHDINLCMAIPGMNQSRLNTHKHMLQVGWDNKGKYDKPTAVISEADLRTTALCNVLRYSDFDQVFQRLMIPELPDDSNMQLIDWQAELRQEDGKWSLTTPDKKHQLEVNKIAPHLFERGVILLGCVMVDNSLRPINKLDEIFAESAEISALLGIAINENIFLDEVTYSIMKPENAPPAPATLKEPVEYNLVLEEPEEKMQLMVIGWVGALPLLVKRLLRFYHQLDLIILDDIPEDEVLSQKSYIERRIAEEPGMEELVSIQIERWNLSNMEFLRKYVLQANHIIISRPFHMKEEAYALISTMLSSIVTIAMDEEITPQVFPVMESRNQALLLQEELAEFELPLEVHVTVPNEFYGAYVSHATFNMYSAADNKDYKLKRILRKSLDKLMTDIGADSEMGLKVFKVNEELPEDSNELFQSLLDAGYIWIGYTMEHSFEWKNPLQDTIQFLFPRKQRYSCERQNHIIINPNGNPISRRSWLDHRDDIVELITIGGDDDVELF